MPRSLISRRRSGLTLIELLVVIAIIGLVVALALPAIQMAREAGRRATCINNLKQLAIAANNHLATKERFPTGARVPDIMPDGRPACGTNWIIELLPYFEQDNLYNQWNYEDNRYNVVGGSNAAQAQIIEILICPSDLLPERVAELTAANALAPPWSWGFYGMSSYGGNAGRRSVHTGGPPSFPRMTRDGIFWIDSSVRMTDVIDGSSNTILFGERYHRDEEYDRQHRVVWPGSSTMAQWGRWGFVANPGVMGNVMLSTAAPINYRVPSGGSFSAVEDRVCAFGSGHPGGANFAFADGSARFVRDSIALDTLQALSTRRGEEAVADSEF